MIISIMRVSPNSTHGLAAISYRWESARIFATGVVAPEKITELDWWDTVEHNGLTITAAPARHFSGRSVPKREPDPVVLVGDSGERDEYFFQRRWWLLGEFQGELVSGLAPLISR